MPAENDAQVQLVAITDLTPNPRNARQHPPNQVGVIAGLMREFGFTNPILADLGRGGLIIAGHGRRLAALEIHGGGEAIRLPNGRALPTGMVPVIDCSAWSEDQRRAYTIADNASALSSTWDDDLLRLELGELRSNGFDLSLTGFDAEAIARSLDFCGTSGEVDPDEALAPPAVPASKPGDIWVMGHHRIICGDSTDAHTVETLLGAEKPHLMVTDPPYGVVYDANWRNEAIRSDGSPVGGQAIGKVLNDDRADWQEAWALFPGNVAYVWHAGLFAGAVATSLEAAGFKLRSQIIWKKSNFAIGRGDYHWHHEPCWYAVKGAGHWQGDRKQSTIWEIPKPSKSDTGHSTQKPVECMRRPIENNSQPGDAVYEPFSGSGTTIIAAEMTGRRCFAIELSPAYVDVAVRRWQIFTGKAAILNGDGRTFEGVSAALSPAA